jgi:hypothetical protein
MRDWEALVEGHLGGLALEPGDSADVVAEIAAHLEESYEALIKENVPEQVAFRRALSQVTNWRDLQRRIFIAKRSAHRMQKRVNQLWIPGFLALILSMVFLMMLQKFGFRPRIVKSGPDAILFYVQWLLSLPLFGALGAYLSSRAGGSRGTALLVSVFPVLALTAAFLLMFPIGLIIERATGNHMDFSFVAAALLRDGIGWLLVPGVALLAGGLLVQLLFSRRSTSQVAAIG